MSQERQPRTCQKCHAPLPDDLEGDVCRACLMQVGFESAHLSPASAVEQTHTDPGTSADQPEDTLDQVQRLFPDLELIELIGQGGMGIVYKAKQKHLGRLVALKLLKPKLSGDPTLAERFTREARALARLSHPNIVGVHDFGQAADRPYLIMEYVDGTNLRHMILQKSLSPEEAIAFVPPICEALQYAHEEGVVHRDIKPENILIDKRGRVRIADFGLARMMTRSKEEWTLTGTRQVMGTPHYMAPEQRDRPQEVDHRADIYSLGVVIYEMLTGELPIGRFELPSRKVAVDVRLDEVVLRTLENEPDRRYQHASDVQCDVTRISTAAQHEFAIPAFLFCKAIVPDYAIMASIVLDCLVVLWSVGALFFDRFDGGYFLTGAIHLAFVGVLARALHAKRQDASSQWSMTATIASLLPLHLGFLICAPSALWYWLLKVATYFLSPASALHASSSTAVLRTASDFQSSQPAEIGAQPDVVDRFVNFGAALGRRIWELPWKKAFLSLISACLWCGLCAAASAILFLRLAPSFIPSQVHVRDHTVRQAVFVSAPDKTLRIRGEGFQRDIRGTHATAAALRFDHIYLDIGDARGQRQPSGADSMHVSISAAGLEHSLVNRNFEIGIATNPYAYASPAYLSSAAYEYRPALNSPLPIATWLVRNGIKEDTAPLIADSLFRLLNDLRDDENQVVDSNGLVRMKPISSMIDTAQLRIAELGGLTVSIRTEEWALYAWWAGTILTALLGALCIFYFIFRSRRKRTTAPSS